MTGRFGSNAVCYALTGHWPLMPKIGPLHPPDYLKLTDDDAGLLSSVMLA